MNTKQYTVRNIPSKVDRYLRKRAQLSGKSLNQVVIDELSERAGMPSESLADSLDWFIGSGTIEDASIQAIEDKDAHQKQTLRKQWDSEGK
ncbi:MAG: hypothetical protein U5K77_02065 [Candidatus Saccharibacteria bacterium]|nr:hypothetical protein [Candidatus Saccharibacteria bacterium]